MISNSSASPSLKAHSEPSLQRDPIVQARLPQPTFSYFNSVFAGDRGFRQKVISAFFLSLHAECERLGVSSEWTPANEDEVYAIVARLNFNPPPKKRKSK